MAGVVTTWLAMAMALASLQGVAVAQTVFRCVAHDATVSYQSQPCAPSARVDRQWDAVPEPLPTLEQTRTLALQRETQRAESEFLSRRAGTNGGGRRNAMPVPSKRREPDRDACGTAKARRDRTLARAGLKRTFDLLRQLDDEVYDACK